jgi:hypothetical protein
MVTDLSHLFDLLRGPFPLRLCHRRVEGDWILIEPNGRQPPPISLPDSAVSGKTAAILINSGAVIDIFAGRRGKYENDIYHLAEHVPPETLAYIERRFPRRTDGT